MQEIFKDKVFGTSGADDDDDDGDAQDGGEAVRKDTDCEPVFFHCLLKALYDTLLGSWSVAGILDLSPGQGELAKSAIEKRLSYVGICLSEAHAVKLKQARVFLLNGLIKKNVVMTDVLQTLFFRLISPGTHSTHQASHGHRRVWAVCA